MNKKKTIHKSRIALAIRADLQVRFIQFIDARPATAATYGRSLRLFFQYLADKGIEAPTRVDLIIYRDALKENHQPATVNAYIIALRQFFKWTEAEGIYKNVATNVKGARIERSFKKDPLTSRQMKAVLTGIERNTEIGAWDYAILSVMTSGGLRTIEATRANIEDLRTLADETILYIQGKGKDQKSDYVKVPAPAEQALRDYLAKRGKALGTEPLFTSISNRNHGQRMTTRSVSRLIKDRFRAAGLDSDRLTAHSLRHTAATLNLLNGGTLDETQQLLRHSRIDTTMIYSHHLDRMKNKSEARIAAAIWSD